MSGNGKLLALLLGAAAGGIIGVLYATDKGADFRKKIAESAGKLLGSVMDNVNEGLDTVSDLSKKANKKVQDFVHEGKPKMGQYSI